jgi:hypothetical protein
MAEEDLRGIPALYRELQEKFKNEMGEWRRNAGG